MKRKRLIGTSEISRATGLAASTVQYPLKRLRDSGAILAQSALINYVALGFSAFDIMIRCAGPAAETTRIFCLLRGNLAVDALDGAKVALALL